MEPGSCLQHRSRSSLLRRMPVRGEYTMAPKLRLGKVGSELGALGPSNTGLQPLRIPYYSAFQHTGAQNHSRTSKISCGSHQDSFMSKAQPRQDWAQGHQIIAFLGKGCPCARSFLTVGKTRRD